MKAIFAVNSVDGFGDGTTMPWPHSPVDLKRFKTYTLGGTVVMGSGTWLSSMPKPLPNRRNVVLSRSVKDTRCEIYPTWDRFMETNPDRENTWIIGGSNVLTQLNRWVQSAYITTFFDATPAQITLDKAAFLAGFVRRHSEEFGDHIFEIWDRAVV